eukprot:Gb_36831 [translate_table: standard]
MGSVGGGDNSNIKSIVWILPQLFGGLVLSATLLTLYFGPDSLPAYFPFSKQKGKTKPVRVYMDRCFDMMHYGHCSALRQARALEDELVIGVISDEEILANKGPPVMSLEERIVMIKRTEGVSSTDIVGRMLLCISTRARELGDFLLVGIHTDQTNRSREHYGCLLPNVDAILILDWPMRWIARQIKVIFTTSHVSSVAIYKTSDCCRWLPKQTSRWHIHHRDVPDFSEGGYQGWLPRHSGKRCRQGSKPLCTCLSRDETKV